MEGFDVGLSEIPSVCVIWTQLPVATQILPDCWFVEEFGVAVNV
jgi:hypothetical protein